MYIIIILMDSPIKQITHIQIKKKGVMTNKKWEEIILVAPRNTVFNNEALAFQGTEQRKEVVDEIIANLSDSNTSFRRGATTDPTPKENNAEINTDYKQPIPYVLIKRVN